MKSLLMVAAISALISSIATGWVINAKHTLADQKRIIAEAKQREQWQQERLKNQQLLDAAMTASSRALQEKQHEIDQISSALAAGSGRVYVRAECPVQASNTNTEQPVRTGARLGRVAEQDYLLLRRGIAQHKKALDDCRSYAALYR